MRAYIKLFILISVFLSQSSVAQINIVPNSGFELMSACPNFGGNWQLCNNWNNVNMNPGPGPWGTPDYFATCGTSGAAPPATFSGTCSPQAGNSMFGLVMYNVPFPNYREYLSAQLTCPMQAGSTYTFSFWITNGTGIKSPWTIRNIGAHFSTAPLSQTGWALVNVTPQCEVTTNIASTSWVQYTFAVTATANWNYITFGCFRDDSQNNPVQTYPNPGGPASVYANYFIDNIEVWAPSGSGGGFSISANVTQPVACGGNGSATITSNSSSSLTYSWSPGGYTSSSVSSLPPGSYSVVASGVSGCTTFSGSTQFTINPTTNLSVNINPQAACKNQTATLSSAINGGTAPFSYTWMPGNINTPAITVSQSATTVYTLNVSDNSGCNGTGTGTLNIVSPVADFNYAQNNCNGNFTITNLSSSSTSYQWDFGDGTTSSQSSPSHSYSGPGTYSITLISSNNGCSDTIQKTISINQIIQSNFNATVNLCDSMVSVTNNSTGGNSYLWKFGDGATSTLQNPSPHTYSSAGNFTIWLVVTGAGNCKDSVSKTVSIIKNSAAGFSFSNPGCSTNVTFSNTSQSAFSYDWNFGNGNTSNLQNPQFNFPAAGVQSVTLTINAGTSCSATITKTLDVGLGPVSNFSFTQNPCNTLIKFTNYSSNFVGSLWDFGDGTKSKDESPFHQFPSMGTYTVTLITNSGANCINTIKQVVTISYTPVIADFDYTNENYTYDVAFKNKSFNAHTHFWDFGDNITSTETHPKHTYEHVAKHTVCLVASNKNGCSDTICKEIFVEAGWTFYVPNTFTPNDDGINEIFFCYGTNIYNFKISIFDRWGEELFSSDALEKGWDGFYKGKPVLDDVYAWKVVFKDYKHVYHHMTGHIQVLR